MSFCVFLCLFSGHNSSIFFMQMPWRSNGNDSSQTISAGLKASICMSFCNHWYSTSISNGKIQLDLKQLQHCGTTESNEGNIWTSVTREDHGRIKALESEDPGFKAWIILLTCSMASSAQDPVGEWQQVSTGDEGNVGSHPSHRGLPLRYVCLQRNYLQ